MIVNEFAREFGVSATDVIIKGKELDIPIKHHANKLNADDEIILRGHFTKPTEILVKPKKKMTKPWDGENNPWSLDMLRLKKKHKGYRGRFTTRDGLQKKLDQGWTLMDAKDWGGTDAVLPGEESQDGTLVKRRELIGIELPEELAVQREEYMDWKTNKRAKEARNVQSKLAKEAELTDKFETHRG